METITMKVVEPDQSHVRVQEVIGSDAEIASNARICMGGVSSMSEKSERVSVVNLIDLLMKRGHTSPFEFGGLTISIKCPIFVARQWMRHRTFRYLERSGRYCNSTHEIYLPRRLQQDTTIIDSIKELFKKYDALLSAGVSKQEARTILPLGMYTEFVFQADLHNLLHFLKLRLSPAAQPEMRFYAQCVAYKVKENFPITWDSFVKYNMEEFDD